jgi:AraC-like DNA-binding protein
MIGKTRHPPRAKVDEVFDADVGRARGVLRRGLKAGTMHHARRRPAADLAGWIAHYWIIRWDLRGCPPYVAENLPHPNVHLICEQGASRIAGVHTHKFSRVIEGEGGVFGVKFRPGGFRPFYSRPISTLANRSIRASRVFGTDLQSLEPVALSAARSDTEKVEAANAFFHARMPDPDPGVSQAAELVDLVLQDSAITTVAGLARRAGLGQRSLQRLFGDYVGASPKWVIRRYRLHELVEKVQAGGTPVWAQVALDLGYFDQAHLVNDFTALVGYSPTEYQKLLAGTRIASPRMKPPRRASRHPSRD